MTVIVGNNVKTGYYNATDGKVYTGTPMLIGQGLPTLRTWVALHYFLNQMRRTAGPIDTYSGSPVVDANGWADCSAPGTQVEYSMGTSNQGQGYTAPTSSTMVLRWNGTGDCNLELSNGFPPLISTSSWNGGTNNRKIYDGSAGSANSGVSVYASDGYPTDIQLFSSTDNEALYDAGNHIHPLFIEDVAEACSPGAPLRFMDVLETNQSGYIDYASFLEKSSTWGNTIDYPRGPRRLYLRSVAEICNEAERDPWICVPMMLDNQAATDMFNDLNTYLDPARKVWVENGNEHWNTGTGFKNGFNWTRMYNAPLHEPTVDPVTGTATDVGHGLSTGNLIYCFNKDGFTTVYPYEGGQESYVIRVDNDNFILGDTIFGDRRRVVTNVTRANPGVVTFTGRTADLANGDLIRIYAVEGMTEIDDIDFQVQNYNDITQTFELYTTGGSPVDTTAYGVFTDTGYFLRHDTNNNSEFTSMYFKNPNERPIAYPTNEAYCNESVRVWDIADTVFGRDRVVHVLSHKFWAGSKFLDADYTTEAREKMDWLAVAPYIDYKRAKGVGIDNVGWETQTNQELADFMIDPYVPSIMTTIEQHIQALGSHRLICYEGGLQIYLPGDSGGVSQAVLGAQLGSFAASSEAGNMYDVYYRGMSSAGMQMHCNYMMTYANCNDVVEDQSNNPLAWGIQTYTGERTQPRWVTTKNFVEAGGVPPG
jgi:hypothetical protein